MELVVGRAHEARGRVADLRVLGDVDEIAARRELAAPGQAVAVHLGDDGLGEVPDPEPAVDDVARPLSRAARRVVRLVDGIVRAEIVARAEGRSRAPKHGDLHGGIGVGLLERGEDRAAQLVVERVALLGPVHREAPDAGARVIDDKHVARGHAGPPWPVVIGLESTRKPPEARRPAHRGCRADSSAPGERALDLGKGLVWWGCPPGPLNSRRRWGRLRAAMAGPGRQALRVRSHEAVVGLPA